MINERKLDVRKRYFDVVFFIVIEIEKIINVVEGIEKVIILFCNVIGIRLSEWIVLEK